MSGNAADLAWQPVEMGKKIEEGGTGYPATGKTAEKHCHQTLAGQGLPFLLKTKETLSVRRHPTLQHLLSPCKGCGNKLCVSAAGTDANAAARLQAEVGGWFLP